MCFGCSKEPSHWESFLGTHNMFWLRNSMMIFMPSYLEACTNNPVSNPCELTWLKILKFKFLAMQILKLQNAYKKLSVTSWNGQWSINKLNINRLPDNGAYLKVIFLISQPKFMLWVHKRTVSMGSILHPKHMFKLIGRKIIIDLCSKSFLIRGMINQRS